MKKTKTRNPWRVTVLYIELTDRITAQKIAATLGGIWKGRSEVEAKPDGQVTLSFRFWFPQRFSGEGMGTNMCIGDDAPRYAAHLFLRNHPSKELGELKNSATADVIDHSRQMFVYGKQYGKRGGTRVTHREYAKQKCAQ